MLWTMSRIKALSFSCRTLDSAKGDMNEKQDSRNITLIYVPIRFFSFQVLLIQYEWNLHQGGRTGRSLSPPLIHLFVGFVATFSILVSLGVCSGPTSLRLCSRPTPLTSYFLFGQPPEILVLILGYVVLFIYCCSNVLLRL